MHGKLLDSAMLCIYETLLFECVKLLHSTLSLLLMEYIARKLSFYATEWYGNQVKDEQVVQRRTQVPQEYTPDVELL